MNTDEQSESTVITLSQGTVVHWNGMPFMLLSDTAVMGAVTNMKLAASAPFEQEARQ